MQIVRNLLRLDMVSNKKIFEFWIVDKRDSCENADEIKMRKWGGKHNYNLFSDSEHHLEWAEKVSMVDKSWVGLDHNHYGNSIDKQHETKQFSSWQKTPVFQTA